MIRPLSHCFLILLAGLSGCKSTSIDPKELPPVEVASNWSLEGSDLPVDSLGKTLPDELFPEPLRLLIEQGLSKSPNVDVAQARLDRAFAQWRESKSGFLPQAELSLNQATTKQNFIGLPIPGSEQDVLSTQFRSSGLGLSTKWELDLWGRIRAIKQRDREAYTAAQKDWEYYLMSLAAQIAKAWADAITDVAQWQLAKQTAEHYALVVSRVKDRYSQGLESLVDLDQMQTDWLAARREVSERRRQYEVSKRILQTLVGEFPDGTWEPVGQLPDNLAPIPAGLPSALLNRRPDLLAAQARVEQALYSLRASSKELLPRLSLTGAAGTSSPALQEVVDSQFGVWSLAGNLTQPILDRGRIRGGIAKAKANHQEVLASYHARMLEAFREVEIALQADVWLREQVIQSHEMLTITKRNDQQAQSKFAKGLWRMRQVVQARQRLLADQMKLNETRRMIFQNRIDLLVALGGGWKEFTAERCDTAMASNIFQGTEP